MKIEKTDLLLVVDVQNDFITGSLAVPDAEDLIPVINKYVERFEYILFSRDMHPTNHCSFVAQGGPWPPHCVIGTDGAKLHSDLKVPGDIFVIDKGTLADKDTYSAFGATQLLRGTLSHGSIIIDKLDLSPFLRLLGIKRLFICGLATEYCVKATVLDAVEKFDGPVFLLTDAIEAVGIAPENEGKAISEMLGAGVTALTLNT